MRLEDLQQVVAQLDIHGVTVDRIVVTEPFEQLSKEAREALRAVERSSTIKVEWLIESLGLRGEETPKAAISSKTHGAEARLRRM